MPLNAAAMEKFGKQNEEGETLAAQAAENAPAPRNACSPTAVQPEELRALREELDGARREQARLHQAIFEAAQVQRRLCAPRELTRGDFEIAGEIFPVRHLSGDFFKVMDLGAHLGIVLGDIAGKGLSAGIWLTYLMGLVQCCAKKHSDPAEVVAEANRQLCEASGEPPMTALFFARLNPVDGQIVYCNAGLPAPLVVRPGAPAGQLEHGGPMLGALPAAKFEKGSVTLHPGDTLIAYSDGVTECRNAQDDEFSTRRLATAAASAGANANETLFSTLGAVLDFAGGCAPGDDLTLLVVRRRESSPARPGRPRCGDFSKFKWGQTPGIQPVGPARQSSVS